MLGDTSECDRSHIRGCAYWNCPVTQPRTCAGIKNQIVATKVFHIRYCGTTCLWMNILRQYSIEGYGDARSVLKHLWRDQNGQDLVEYALLAGFVATGSAVLLPTIIHDNLSQIYSKINSNLLRVANN